MKLLGCGANANSYAFDSKVHGWIQCQSPRQRTRVAIALVWTFMFLPNSYVAILIPNGMVLGGGAFGNWWCHGGGVLRKGINTLLKETRRTPLPFHLVRTQGEDCWIATSQEKRPPKETSPANTLSLNFSLPAPEGINSYCWSKKKKKKNWKWHGHADQEQQFWAALIRM